MSFTSHLLHCLLVCVDIHLLVSACGSVAFSLPFFFFNGCIQDIRACQRPRRKKVGVFSIQRTGKPREASSVYSSKKMDWPAHKLSSCEELNQKQWDSWTEQKGHDLLLLFSSTSSVICFPARPLRNINMPPWIGGLLYVCLTPVQHNEREDL